MKALCLILAMLILLSGCTSVPRVGAPKKAESPREFKGEVYTVRISGDFARQEDALKYAINEFVKSKGYESYNAELKNKPGFFRSFFEYTVTMPGTTPVEDLPEVRYIDSEATGFLIGTPIVIVGGAGVVWFVLWILTLGAIGL